jgi:hypothetical protein
MHAVWGTVAVACAIATGCGRTELVFYAQLPEPEQINCAPGTDNGPGLYPLATTPDGANVFFVVERDDGHGYHRRLEIGAARCEDAERINDYHDRFLGVEAKDGGRNVHRALYDGGCAMTLQTCVEAERDPRHRPPPLMWAGAHVESSRRGAPSGVPKSRARMSWLRLIGLGEHAALVRAAAWVHEEATVNGNFMGRYAEGRNDSESTENLVLSTIGWRVESDGPPQPTSVADYSARTERCDAERSLAAENALASSCEHSTACDESCVSPEDAICADRFQPAISCDGEERWR